MTARHSRLATASIITTEAMLDAEFSVQRIKQALADGLQPHDVPEILTACAEVEQHTAEIREQMKEVRKVEKDIHIARRVLNVGWEELWDERNVAEARRALEEDKAPTRLHPVRAHEKDVA